MANNVFEPPRSNIDLQEEGASARTKAVSAGLLGVLCGFFLWAQFLTLPIEWIKPLVPPIKAVVDRFPPDFGYNLALATLKFAASIPNTFLISIICAYTIHLTGKNRLTLYSALTWPALLFIFHWLNVAYRVHFAARRGFDPETVYFIARADFSAKAILIFLVYVLFLLLVFLLLRVVRKNRLTNRSKGRAQAGAPELKRQAAKPPRLNS